MSVFADACRQRISLFFTTLTSAQSAVAQGNLLYMFAHANTQYATAPTGTPTATATRLIMWTYRDLRQVIAEVVLDNMLNGINLYQISIIPFIPS